MCSLKSIVERGLEAIDAQSPDDLDLVVSELMEWQDSHCDPGTWDYELFSEAFPGWTPPSDETLHKAKVLSEMGDVLAVSQPDELPELWLEFMGEEV